MGLCHALTCPHMQTQQYKAYTNDTDYTRNAHKAWQAQVCLSSVGNSCWHIWDSQMSSEHILGLHNQLFTHAHTNCDLAFPDSTNISDIFKILDSLRFIAFSCLSHSLSSCPPAFPAGLILQVDGKERRADCVCGGQRHLPQADVTATGLFLPLQWRLHRHQKEEVSLPKVARELLDSAGGFCVWFRWCERGLGVQVLLITHLFWHVEGESVTIRPWFSLSVTVWSAYAPDPEHRACSIVFSILVFELALGNEPVPDEKHGPSWNESKTTETEEKQQLHSHSVKSLSAGFRRIFLKVKRDWHPQIHCTISFPPTPRVCLLSWTGAVTWTCCDLALWIWACFSECCRGFNMPRYRESSGASRPAHCQPCQRVCFPLLCFL